MLDFQDTRYNRQELMPQLGSEAQSKLSNSRVVSIGAGGVKSPFLYYLAAAGIGEIHIVDYDVVELSNLNRQILYTQSDIGAYKAEAAARRVRDLNPDIKITFSTEAVTEATIDDICGGYDVLIEGGDSPEGRMLANQFALGSNVPLVHASAQYGYGYVMTVLPHMTACMRCVFDDLPAHRRGSVPVFGVATGIAGTLGANEVVKVLTGQGKLATDGLFCFSAFQNDFYSLPRTRRTDCDACGSH